MSLEEDIAKYVGLIEKRKIQIVEDMERLGWDSYSNNLHYACITDPEQTKGIRYILGDWPGGQQIFVPQVVKVLKSEKHPDIPTFLVNRDEEFIVREYLFRETTEHLFFSHEPHFPLVTPLNGEIRRFGLVLKGPGHWTDIRGLPSSPDLIDRYCDAFDLSNDFRYDAYIREGFSPNFNWAEHRTQNQ